MDDLQQAIFNLRYDLASCLVDFKFSSEVGLDFCYELKEIIDILGDFQREIHERYTDRELV